MSDAVGPTVDRVCGGAGPERPAAQQQEREL
jgi:hypothetical protein